MKALFTILIFLLVPFFVLAGSGENWYKIKYDVNNLRLISYVHEGIIEADLENPGTGWMTKKNYHHYASFFDLEVIDKKNHIQIPINSKISPDSIGQVLAIFPLPVQVESIRGLGFDGKYFWIADAKTNSEKIHKLDPNNNFNVVHTFTSPGPGSLLPWGVACDGNTLYIADGLQDAIFKTDTLGNILATLPSGGPLSTGLGYRAIELWNADLGDQFGFPSIPKRMYKMDTLGTNLSQYNISNTINGVAGNDSVVFYGRNKNNGEDILLVNPAIRRRYTEYFHHKQLPMVTVSLVPVK